MELSTYLKYNGVHLIDPLNGFHASCIQFFNDRGFLAPKQVQALKNYVFSPADIERLLETNVVKTPEPIPCKRPKLPTTPAVVEVESQVEKKKKKKKKNKNPKSIVDEDVTDLF